MATWLSAVILAAWLGRSLAADTTLPLDSEGSNGGVEVGNTGLWVGGYATLEGVVPQSQPNAVTLGDVGLLVRYELTPTLAFFNETDLDDAVSLVEGSGIDRGSRILLLERLYLDWSPDPHVTVRVGKFLTPFGIWNVIRRAPLTWTVDRPVATQDAFPEHITGTQLVYQTTRSGWSLDATAYGQATEELVRGASDTSADAAGGGRVVAGRAIGPAYLAWGISTTAFENADTNRWEDSYGTDIDLTAWSNLLQGEFAYTRLRQRIATREWGFYLQDVFPLVGALYGVFRFEHVVPPVGPTVNGELVGLAWHIHPHVVLKADYQFADHEGSASAESALERGFAAAVTFFF